VINLSDTKATIEVTFSVQLNLGEWRYPTAVKAIKSSALDFIQKPFCAEEIVRQLENVLRGFVPPKSKASETKLSPFNFPGREPLTPKETTCLK
jgi:FixJ family two-component response regulator